MKPCCLDDLKGWLDTETWTIPEEPYQQVILAVNANLGAFVQWPQRAEVLWAGCDRKREQDQKQRYHRFPEILRPLIRQHKFTDRRSNGPAKLAYLVAGGERRLRARGKGWNIHHLYDGQFPYPGSTRQSLRAVMDARHFYSERGSCRDSSDCGCVGR